MSFSISSAYVQGIQSSMYNNGLINYASEEAAVGDAEALSEAIEHHMPVDRGGLAAEGASPDETHAVADALSRMSQAPHAEEKMAAVRDAIDSLTSGRITEFSKFAVDAASPGDNNVVSGHRAGRVAAGEGSAKYTDHDEELSNAVHNTAHRENVFHSKPGHQSNKGRGASGHEGPHPHAEGNPGQHRDHDRELSNAVHNTAHRANMHGAPGRQHDGGKGHSGTEKGASLSSILSRL